jgi:hypothetical protein
MISSEVVTFLANTGSDSNFSTSEANARTRRALDENESTEIELAPKAQPITFGITFVQLEDVVD